MAANYYGSSSDDGDSVYSGASGRVQFADSRYAEAYVVYDGKGDSEMYARVTDPAGAVLRTIEVKEDSDENYDPSVAALGNHAFVVTWTNSDDDDAATDTHVLARVYTNDGATASPILQVSGNGKQHADESSVVGLNPKEFVVAYENDTTHEVHAAVYTQSVTGKWTEHDTVVSRSVGSNGGDPTVSRVNDNTYVVHYTDANGHQATYQASQSSSGVDPGAGSGHGGGLGGLLGSLHLPDHLGF